MATKFVPLNSKLIDEGLFMEELDVELAELQRVMSTYARKHGEKALKAVGKLVIEIGMKCETVNPDCDDNAFSIKTSIKATHPKRPSSTSMAITGQDATGQPCLFVRASGSDDMSPNQSKMFTRDGRTIDHNTGEALDD